MKTIMTTLALILALGVVAALADELPAAAQRIWAPAGDEIGTAGHLTATGVRNDDHGDAARAAQDESIQGDWLGLGLLGWFDRSPSGRRVDVRGLVGNTEGGGLAGDGLVRSATPGVYSARIAYHAHDLFYDRDSELRNPVFPTVLPPQLAFTPHLEWRRGRADLSYHLASAFDLYLGADDLRREGRKSSRLGMNPPNVQAVDTRAGEFWLGAVSKLGDLATDVKLSYLNTDDTLGYATGHTKENQRDRYSADFDAAYAAGNRIRLVAAGRWSRLENTGSEMGVVNAGGIDGDTDSAAYQIGAISRLGRATTLRLSARFDTHDTEASTADGADVIYGAHRERDRQQYEVTLGDRSLPRTDLQLRYRYTTGDETQDQAEGARPTDLDARVFTLDQATTRHDAKLRARTRLAPHVKLSADVRYTSLDVDQSRSWDAGEEVWFGVLGDHKVDRTSYRLALQTRPHAKLPLDLGVRGFDRTFKRTEAGGAETTASQLALFANTNWRVTPRLTVYGMVTYGKETYELTGAEPAAGFEAFNVDANTVRFSPGATFMATDRLQIDGWYEGVSFEDTGDQAASRNAINSDRDRLSLRVRYQATERLAVTAGYARNEFDENRWDDSIQDLWSLSAHTSF
ncbi:MAG: hypothetical protein R3D98_11565 [Candidatus Krumholzibacteriia bacterium]